MKKNGLLGIVFLLILTHFYFGCGYTILRDFEEEARQAELAAIDSLTFAPDLAITNIEYSYVPPPPRRNSMDRMVFPPQVEFRLTIANIGNADFCNPYMVVFNGGRWEYLVGKQKFNKAHPAFNKYWIEHKKKQETIFAGGKEVLEFQDQYPYHGGFYTFVIVTNPKIQRQVSNVDDFFSGYPYEPIPITREFRYDNNTDTIAVPGSKSISRGG